MTRDWILSILEQLPVWCWPVFLWDVLCMQLRLAEMEGEVAGLFTLGVTPEGRIIVLDFYEADRPGAPDWAAHAPRAPWAALDLDILAVQRVAFSAIPLAGDPASCLPCAPARAIVPPENFAPG